MIIKRFFISLAFILILCKLLAARIGMWKTYMAYSNITWVEQSGNNVYVLASNNLYAYNKNDKSILTYDKTNGLNDAGISFIAWNKSTKRLVIVYSNNNIDLLGEKGNVVNVMDYYNSSITADKTINSVDMNGDNCYLSTGFGIVKLNVAKAEISDTYNLGFNVNYSYIEGNYIYAAGKSNGLYRALLTDNLLNRNNWTRTGNYVERNKTVDADLLESVKTLNPGGPKYNNFSYMQFQNNRLYTVGGKFKSGEVAMDNPGTVQVLQDNNWNIYQDNLSNITGYSYTDNNTLAIDPKDAEHVFVGGKTGLYEFQNGQLKAYYNKDNSLLHGAIDRGKELGNDYVLVNGLCFDNEGNLWILNSQSNQENLLRLSADGKMTSHYKDRLTDDGIGLSYMGNLMQDSHQLLWFCNDHFNTPGLFSYQPSTDELKSYTRLINEDGVTLKINAVHCMAEDANNNLWIGTTVGPLLLERAQMGDPDNAVFNQIKVPRNDGTNLADYLLSGSDITCMAIDGAGRKWFGTSADGVYLISEDNLVQLQHFTAENSKLLSNSVESIAINQQTGEVFFGTGMGLCSYMSDATATNETMTKDNVWAYPNPVRPDFTGLITVTGLSYNADVKITTSNGVLVANGRSNGGIFTWDGCDLKGRKVASGVYMVQTATASGDKGVVCKIAIVR